MIRFFHGGVTVSDLRRSVRFYCDGLGFELDFEQERAGEDLERITGEPGVHTLQAHLQDPGSPARLELLQYVAPEGRPDPARPRDPGTGHLAFLTDDIDALFARLLEHGGTPISPAPVSITSGGHSGARALYMRDPDGYIVELVQRAEGR